VSLGDYKALWLALGVVAVIAIVVIVMALSDGGGGDTTTGSGDTASAAGYSDANRRDFLARCAAGLSESECECAWQGIVDEIPHDEFVAKEAELAEAAEAGVDVDLGTEYPELHAIREACIGAGSA
jgi:hypothetical protein